MLHLSEIGFRRCSSMATIVATVGTAPREMLVESAFGKKTSRHQQCNGGSLTCRPASHSVATTASPIFPLCVRACSRLPGDAHYTHEKRRPLDRPRLARWGTQIPHFPSGRQRLTRPPNESKAAWPLCGLRPVAFIGFIGLLLGWRRVSLNAVLQAG